MVVSRSTETGQALWRELNRHRGVLSAADQGDLVLTLLYVCGVDPRSWKGFADEPYVEPQDVELAVRSALPTDGNDLSELTRVIRQAAESRELTPIIHSIRRCASEDVAFLFSDLLSRFAAAEGRKGGEFHTPKSIADLAVQLLEPLPSDRIFDPSCGTGSLLAAAVDDLLRRGHEVDRLSISGSTFTTRSCRIAHMNVRLRNVVAKVSSDAGSLLQKGHPNDRYTLVVSNPPFNMSNWTRNRPSYSGWRYRPPPEHNANFAWLQYIVSSLDQGGRAAVVMTNGAGSSDNRQERDIRKAMLHDGVVSAVIALPPQLFPSTPIPVTLWLLRGPSAHRGDILFMDATTMGTMHERTHRTLTESDIEAIGQAYTGWQLQSACEMPEFAASASLDRIAKAGYRLNPREYVASSNMALSHAEAASVVGRLHGRLDELQAQADQIDTVVARHLERIRLWTP